MVAARLTPALFAALFALAPAASSALGQASGAYQPPKASLRLLDGGTIAGERFAGLEIVLPKDTITYWRHPGEAGIPPTFDFAASKNLAAASPLYPAPSKLDEGGSIAFGYAGRVVFPIRIAPQDARRSVDLALELDYAICERICIPAQASLKMTLPPGAAGDSAVAQALAAVPRAVLPAAPGDLAVLGAEPVEATPPTLAAWRVSTRLPGPTSVFAEVPEGYWVEAADVQPGESVTLRLVEAPKARAARLPVRLTLVSGESAIETMLDLDLAALKP